MAKFKAAYLNLLATGELERRVAEARRMLEERGVWGRGCAVNRLDNAKSAD